MFEGKLNDIKSEIISTWDLNEQRTNWVKSFKSVEDLLICLNDLTGQIVWNSYDKDTTENRKQVRAKLIDIVFGEIS